MRVIECVCTACGATPGQRCTQPTNTGRRPVTWFHSARTDLAEGWYGTTDEEG